MTKYLTEHLKEVGIYEFMVRAQSIKTHQDTSGQEKHDGVHADGAYHWDSSRHSGPETLSSKTLGLEA